MLENVDRPLRVALIHTSDSGGGAERSVLMHHETLLDMGHASRLYVGRRETDVPHVVEIGRFGGVRGLKRLTLYLERCMGWQYLYAPGFRSLAEALPPSTDVVHITSLFGAEGYADVGALPRLTQRFPSIITLQDSWLLTGHCACPITCSRWTTGCGKCPDLDAGPPIPRDGSRFNWNRKRRCISRSPVRFTVVSEWLKCFARRSPIVGSKPVSVVYNNVDDDLFKPGSKARARAELGVPQDVFVVLLAGQDVLSSVKGTTDAIEAFQRLRSERFHALLVGRNSQEAAEMLPIPAVAMPFETDYRRMVTYFRAADLTVMPSHFETFGRVAAESQACGTPVIVYDAGGLPEVVRHGVGGLVVRTGDIPGLTEALRSLITNRATVKRMSRAGIEWVRRFARARISERYLEQYRVAILARRDR